MAVLERISPLLAEGNSPTSEKRFCDGAQYRIEIPSCEGPQCMLAVLEEARRYELTIHRVSQGSGIMMLTDSELKEMLHLGRESCVEISLFVSPRATFDISPQPFTSAGKVIGCNLRGRSQLGYAVEDVHRGCELGLRSILVADIGLLYVLNEMKRAGELPNDLVIKISLQLSITNPASAKVIADLGASTINVSPDLTIGQLSSIRQAVEVPIDVYVEVPDGFGGYVRYYEAPEMVRVASPIYLKLGLRNAPDIYPSGGHLQQTAVAMSRERVRRARLLVDLLQRSMPSAIASKKGCAGLGIPANGR